MIHIIEEPFNINVNHKIVVGELVLFTQQEAQCFRDDFQLVQQGVLAVCGVLFEVYRRLASASEGQDCFLVFISIFCKRWQR